MCIHYRRQVDLPGINLFLDYGRNSAKSIRYLFRGFRRTERTPADSLDQL